MEPLVEFKHVGARLLHVEARAVIGDGNNWALPHLAGRLQVYLQRSVVGAVLYGVG